jgi:CheY-like chemotaxis protein
MAKILVIDDEQGIRDLLDRLLLRQGYDVVLAENGWTGLELFCRESPDVIILDLKMPGIDGFTTLEQVRRLKPHQRVIILTGAGTPEIEQQVRALGVTEYIEKESSLHLIDNSLERLLCANAST